MMPRLRAWFNRHSKKMVSAHRKSPLRRAAFFVFLAVMVVVTLHVSFHIALGRVRTSERQMDLAVTSMMAGRYTDTLDHYDKALQGNRWNQPAWSGRALALLYLKRYDEALKSYERAIRLSPDDAPSWQGKGMSLEYMGRYNEAITSYNHAIELNPTFGLAIQLRDRLDIRIHQLP
jgi:tetratricopeptide (TPR) repeat protein